MRNLLLASILFLSVNCNQDTLKQKKSTNIALDKKAIASTIETDGTQIPKAFDGDMNTRWASKENSDKEWIYVDLNETVFISRVVLKWEFSYGNAYTIDISDDTLIWTTIFKTTTGNGGVDTIDAGNKKCRFVRMNASKRGTPYGYSLFELEVLDMNSKNLALNKAGKSSSIETDGTQPYKAIDGDMESRWASAENAGEAWIFVDLEKQYEISRIVLQWELAYAAAYQLQISDDAKTWKAFYSEINGNGEIDIVEGLSVTGRYVRLLATKRGTAYAYSLYEFEVYAKN